MPAQPLKKHLGFLSVLMTFVCTCTVGLGQTAFFNNGAIISIGEGTQIGVIGNMVTQGSNIDVVTSANLRVEGNLTVSSNTLSALSSAQITVTNNLIILAPGTVFRSVSGVINVGKNVLNAGILDNQGTINIGKP